MSLIKIAGRNRIFSSLEIEAKLMKNLLPLGPGPSQSANCSGITARQRAKSAFSVVNN